MNIDTAIEVNRLALLRLLAGMMAVVGVEQGGTVGFVQQRVRLTVLRLLGPAEAALRRLILMKARFLPTPEYVRRPAPDRKIPRSEDRLKRRSFPLFDRRKTARGERKQKPKGPGPRIFFLDGSDGPYTPEPEKSAVQPDDWVDAAALCARLNAALDALGDLDKQAKRLKRAEARRKLSPRLSGVGVMRVHLPPGHRAKGRSDEEREVDTVLWNCHVLARQCRAPHDTS